MPVVGGPDIVTEGLILYLDAANAKSYPRSGNVWYDLTGNSSDGLFTNDPVFDENNSGSFVFNGTTDKITIKDSGTLGGTSVCFWIKGNLTGTRQALFSGMIDNYIIYFDTAGRIGSGATSIEGNSTIVGGFDDGNWYHVGVIKNGTNDYTFIVNGVDFSGGESSGWRLTNATLIGASAPNLPFDGRISCIQTYNRSLSFSEVLQNYDATKSRYK